MNSVDINTVPFCETSASEHDVGFLFSFGAYGDTHVVVLAAHLEDALEEALEWLDDNAPGLLSTVGPEDYKRAARELGVAWEPQCVSDDDMTRVTERAEADMTMVSHTTLEHGNCIPSWEWTARELDAAELAVIVRRNDRATRHWVAGSGMSGCMFDYGPNAHETQEDAIEDLCQLFGDSISEEELNEMKTELKRSGLHYFNDASEAGAQYCSVSEESGPCPTDEES